MWFLVACSGGGDDAGRRPADGPLSESALPSPHSATTPSSSGATGDTAHTGVTDPGPDCSIAPSASAPVPFPAIHTEEDFDFDGGGLLLSQRNTNLVGIERDGDARVVAAAIGYDAAGIRALPDGRVVVAEPDTAQVDLVDPATGGVSALATGLDFPNGLEVGRDGLVYVSEFVPRGHVRTFDPSTGETHRILDLDYPNGMALSPDEQVLYVVSSAGLLGLGASTVYALRRDGRGWEDAATVFYDGGQTLGGLTTDACGRVYVVEYSSGRVWWIAPEGGAATLLTTLTGLGYWSSLRFSPGLGGWATTELYATSRREFYAIEVGVEGRHVLTP